MRATFFMKIFFLCTMCSILALLYVSVRDVRLQDEIALNRTILLEKALQETSDGNHDTKSNENGLKYILIWTSPKTIPFVFMGVGQQGFLERNCSYANCFVTSDRNYLKDYTKFDVIMFHGPEIARMSKASLPSKRSPHQKFVFASIESSDNYPVCSNKFNDFFNWTWTYKLNSDSRWGYMVVRDADNKVIGPKTEMHWIKFEDMDPVSDELKEQLKTKKKAAAWFVSNCYARSGREKYVKKLQNELKNFDLDVDIYGRCGPHSCSPEKGAECENMVKTDYYFYLSFENSFSEDYVTEKLLTALRNTAVPIVYGGANYTRFMPDGIYLNAMELSPDKLAAKMNELIKSPEGYAEYFRWKKYYSYHKRHESLETDDYCRFCSILYEKDLVEKTTIYHNFRQWWDPPKRC